MNIPRSPGLAITLPVERLLPFAVIALGLVAAVAVGYGTSRNNLLIPVASVALVAGLVLCAYPALVLWSTLLLGLVVAGTAKLYMPAVQEIRWAAVPLTLLLAGFAVLGALSTARERVHDDGLPSLFWAAVAAAGAILLTATVNAPEPMQLIRGLKGYFQVWGVILALALLPWPREMMRRQLPLGLFWIAVLQLPFVAQQYLMLVPQRAALELKGLVPADVIGGTFGANVEGGGSNSMLAVYMFVVVAGLAGLWRAGAIRGIRFALLGAPLMVPLLLNQAKVSLLYLVVVFVVVFGADVVRRPGRFFGVGVLAVVAVGAMLSAYSMSGARSSGGGWADLIEETYVANVEEDYQSRGSFTRAGALRYWVEQHVPSDVYHALLGHGVYESRTGSEGAAALWDSADRSLGIKNTAISALLWDVGLLGLAGVFGLLAFAFVTAGRLARRHADDAWLAGLCSGARAGVAILFLSLWVKSYFTYHLAYQTLFVFMVGWLVYWARRVTDKHRCATRRGWSPLVDLTNGT